MQETQQNYARNTQVNARRKKITQIKSKLRKKCNEIMQDARKLRKPKTKNAACSTQEGLAL